VKGGIWHCGCGGQSEEEEETIIVLFLKIVINITMVKNYHSS